MATIEEVSDRLGELVKTTRQIAEAVIRVEMKLGAVEAGQARLHEDINGNGTDGLKMEVDRLKRRETVNAAGASGRWAAIAQTVATLGALGIAVMALLK